MTKDDVIDLIKDAGFGFLATAEGKQPHVRPMMPHLDENGNLLLAVLSHLRTIQQIKENPLVEICYVDRKMRFCRVKGKASVSTNATNKEIVFNNIPMLRQYFTSPQDPNFTLLEIETGTVEAMSPGQKAPDILSLK
ncbi:MAG TPA: pyridoxamine 5'-phosphate oxidase family protein [Candidatus Omnitrophota bacterium]|nr:pyridoxamine 5'-phosphate oxidase family protein [Candidatus Omnitrophota bacterium]HPD85209.1 pyridoxamine 5'-phosphate oxidase family protein [Candidatus Omnitrophota bacterium]HRZ04290.1 pyridoxamine 5'-phosphate oxidase family protein [Candidatus Omnitrophota bacterium]